MLARREQIDERDVARLGDLGHRLRVQRQPLVVLLAVGQVGIAQVLVRDRREQHEPRRRLAVVLLRQRVRDPVGQVLLERVEPGLAGERLVVAEEREDDVGLGVGAGEAILLVAADRRADAAQPLVRRAEVLRAQARR